MTEIECVRLPYLSFSAKYYFVLRTCFNRSVACYSWASHQLLNTSEAHKEAITKTGCIRQTGNNLIDKARTLISSVLYAREAPVLT